jgi:chromosome segregation ATPase
MMESPRTSTPSTLSIDAHHQSSRFQGIPDHLEVVEKVNNCAQQLTTAFNQLLETTKWDIDRARQETKLIEERLQDSESEKAELLQRLREIEDKYEALEDVVMEKDEEIQQKCKALQLAAEENAKLEHGRALAIAVMNETQHNAAISEALANERAEEALQAESASHYRAQKLQEERNCAANARDAAESRAEDAEKARKEAETRAEQAEQAKKLAEERAKWLESNQASMISSRQQAETRAEKAEADLAVSMEKQKEARRLLEIATPIDRVEAATCVRLPKKRHTNSNKRSRPPSSTATKRREFREPEAAYHDQRLEDLAEDLNRVVKDWGTETERYALFTFTNDSITVARGRRGRDTCESLLRVRCVRHNKDPVITVFSVISLARAIYGADLDSKAAEELLRAYISQTVSRRHAQNLDVGEETERVMLFRWANLVDILNEIARVYHKPDSAAGTI